MDEEDEEGDLPEMDEDEIAFEEGLIAEFEGFTNEKNTTEVNKLHPKLIPLLLSIVFMLISFTTVSYSSLLLDLVYTGNRDSFKCPKVKDDYHCAYLKGIFKLEKNDLLAISSFILEMFTFLYHANVDVMTS